jgi:hypothetical protein
MFFKQVFVSDALIEENIVLPRLAFTLEISFHRLSIREEFLI